MTFRLADTISSVAAFTIAYGSLSGIEAAIRYFFPTYLKTMEALSPSPVNAPAPPWIDLSWIFVAVTIVTMLTGEHGDKATRLYRRSVRQIVSSQFTAAAVAVAVAATIFYTLRVPQYSRIFLFTYVTLVFLFTVGHRLLARSIERRQQKAGAARRRQIVAGTPEGIEEYLSFAANLPEHLKADITGCLLTQNRPDVRTRVQVLGTVDVLGDLLIHQPIDEVIIILPDGDARWLARTLTDCDYLRVGVRIVHQSMLDLELRDLSAFDHNEFPVPSLALIPEEEFLTGRLLVKRVFDIVFSFVALVFLFPIMLAIAIAIKITTPDLPIFYSWKAVGYRGRHFTDYKFTTMIADADKKKAALASLNEMSGPVFKIKNDPRITPLGKFLRKYSLNELPQFWCVLVGDMSVVGPRPALPSDLADYQSWHKRRLSVKPGLTCFWQVRGRNAISNFDDWVKMDFEYIQKQSVWIDMMIILRTVGAVIKGTGC